jgi:hypothetical protein
MSLLADGSQATDFSGQANSALAGLQSLQNQPTAAPPTAAAPPVQAPPTFFGRILQGALYGLAGGIKSGAENIAGAGTPGFTPRANGAEYAQKMQDQQNAQDQANQKQAAEQAQQKFENDSTTYRNQQAALAQKAQMYQANINALQAGQMIQNATADQQASYFNSQEQKGAQFHAQGVPVQGKFVSDASGGADDKLAMWMKQNHKELSDFVTTHTQDAQGHDVITAYDNPDHMVPQADIQKQLTAMGSKRVAPGDMSFADAHALTTSEDAAMATQRRQEALENLRFQHESQLKTQEAGNARSLEMLKEKAAGGADYSPDKPLPDAALESNVDSLHAGNIKPADLAPGMGTQAGIRRTNAIARYNFKYLNPASPDYDKNAVPMQTLEAQDKYTKTDKYNQATTGMTELFGSDGTGNVPANRGAMEDLHNALVRVNKKFPPTTHWDATVIRNAQKGIGDPDVVALMSAANEAALRYQKFASGGGIGSQSEWEAVRDAMAEAQPLDAINAKFAHLNDLGAQAASAIIQHGGQYAKNDLRGVRVPQATAIDQNMRERGIDNQGNAVKPAYKVGDTVQTKNGPRTIKSITKDAKGNNVYQ